MTATPTTDAPYRGGNSIGFMVPPGWYTRSQAAAMIGRSYRTLRRWEDDVTDPVAPSGAMTVGKVVVGLYSPSDIDRLREKASSTRPGRKPREAK